MTTTTTTTTTLAIDLSRVPALEKRQQAKALLAEINAIDDESYPAWKASYEQLNRAVKACDEEVRAVRARHAPAIAAAEAALDATAEPFRARKNAVRDRLDALGVSFLGDDYETIQTCVVSGLPLLEDDELWTSDDHGSALMALMPPAADDDAEDDTEAEADEEPAESAA